MNDPAPTRKPPQPKRLIALILALVLGLLLPELSLRFLLFGEGKRAQAWGASWRQPGLFTHGQSDPNYWRLRHQFGSIDEPDQPGFYDSELGWVRRGIDPVTYQHVQASLLNGRRPVLLYGASYAQCVTPARTRFTTLLERSEAGADFALINYGVGGYGLDQMLLMYRKTIHLYEGLNPIVIFAPVIESDLERVMIDFRTWPKPFFTLESGSLVLHNDLAPSSSEYLATRGLTITSYGWNYLRHGSQLMSSTGSLAAEQANLVAAITRAISTESKANDHETFMLLFRTRQGLEPDGLLDPRAVQLKLAMSALDLDWVDTRPFMVNAGHPPEELYIAEGVKRNHPTELGNQILLRAILAGIAGQFDHLANGDLSR